MARDDGWNSSAERVGPGAAASTEKLNGAGETYGRTRPSRTRRIVICLALIFAVLAAGGITVGVLIAKKVIHVGGNEDVRLDSDTASPNESGSASAGSTVTGGAAGQTPTATSTRASTATSSTATSTPTPVACTKSDGIPSSLKGTWMDVTSWADMTGFNCTFTDATVGDLPIVGLNSSWDDSAQANPNVPALNKPWDSYGKRPIRGVNLGGWLSLEPFITPSLFDPIGGKSIGDEYTLCSTLGPDQAAKTLEKHYATFITEDDFKQMAAAGLDHVRIPYSYWAVKTYDGDPYVFGVSWRYLLRGIEWARKYGLRVNLDLHAVPGSQNGWNHSGRQGTIGWLAGSDGAVNAQRSLDIHNSLSKFFAQDRYKNVIAFYGLVNEPGKAITQDDLVTWHAEAYKIVKDNGVTAAQVFSDCLLGLPAWKGKLQGYGDSLVVDAHQYTLFDDNLIALKHAGKIQFACQTYSEQVTLSVDTSTGFGPTMVGEWSQADTDCTKYLNGVGNGARWVGTFSANGDSPKCPTQDKQCSCDQANADPSTFSSDYKSFLLTWAEAQMSTFEKSWGWFYWTWKTESAPLWSYKAGLDGKYMPPVAYERSWDCSKSIPSFGSLPEYY
ncbi:glycoside hydrolase [Thozetella sp. PMI_491]|nr:glycoside hydrolase [Thozetella sp. PMI_491]